MKTGPDMMHGPTTSITYIHIHINLYGRFGKWVKVSNKWMPSLVDVIKEMITWCVNTVLDFKLMNGESNTLEPFHALQS